MNTHRPTLTEADVKPHRISYTLDRPPDTVQAAYMALSDDGEWLQFRDHEHDTVAQAPKTVVALAQRVEPEPEARSCGRRARRGDDPEGHAE